MLDEVLANTTDPPGGMPSEGGTDGCSDVDEEGEIDGCCDGVEEGEIGGFEEGESDGFFDGDGEGERDGCCDEGAVGRYVCSSNDEKEAKLPVLPLSLQTVLAATALAGSKFTVTRTSAPKKQLARL
jgi:hypothetical protein